MRVHMRSSMAIRGTKPELTDEIVKEENIVV